MTHARRIPVIRTVVLILVCAGIVSLSADLGATWTFLLLDAALAVYLAGLLAGRLRWLLLVHPVFIAASMPWFEVPFDDIATGYSYTGTFTWLVDVETATIDWPRVIAYMFYPNGTFEWQTSYALVIPYLWVPVRLFGPDVALEWPHVNYLSQHVSTLAYASAAVLVCRGLGRVPSTLLTSVTVMCTVSPTFLEMHSALHRYSPLVIGLVLVWAGYLTLASRPAWLRLMAALSVIAVGLVLVVVSKSPLILSLALFVVLERLSAGRVPVVSEALAALDRRAVVTVVVIGFGVFQVVSPLVAPSKYVDIDSQLGGEYPVIQNLPVIGFVLRVVYAQLSPFPILGFSQWDLYGGNVVFPFVHVASAVLASWIVLSAFLRLPAIMAADAATRITVVFGFGVLASLAFGAVGYLVYIAPALPFLAAALVRRDTRVPLAWAVGFVAGMEVLAQTARFLRG